MSTRRVWMDSWQFECCGAPFGVGSEVSWTVNEPDVGYVSPVVGADQALTVTDHEEHHGDEDQHALHSLSGRVLDTEAVFVRYAPASGSDRGPPYPVAGTAMRRKLDSVAGFETAPEDSRLISYLIRVDTID